MAGQTYQVNYIIDVNATNAQSAINSFKQAVSSLNKATKPITDLQRQMRSLMETMSALGNKTFTVKVDTKPATQKIGKLIRALQMARNEVQQLNAMGVNLGNVKIPKINSAASTVTSTAATKSKSKSKISSRKSPKVQQSSKVSNIGRKNLDYQLFGLTPLPNNGGIAIDMLKGMGIAYGISGLGSLISNVVEQSVDYDNTMKTVENILKSHDNLPDFGERFSSMTSTIRDVGMKTKYKITEVADAAKFLAMAGLDVDAISQAIRPIADIALVGDTELGETADLVTNIMTAYNIAPNKMRNAADIMTNTFTMSNTTLTEIAESYKYAASLLSAGGVSFEESTAAIGVLGDAGVKGSQAGTTLRTIMANIVNPTKKQKAAWDKLGIKRYNDDGTRKSLIEIFRELNQADLDVSSFYNLFHKTAASGAVALADHVQKWEDIYLENFDSVGLSGQLAYEKQNTIQGLWAQLTSVFTDNGVTAFGGIQGQIRSIMSNLIEWLKTDEAVKKFKEISSAIMQFVHTIMTTTKWLVKFYEMSSWFIKPWIKFQLMVWPVVKAITTFKSIILGLTGLRKIGFVIIGLSNAFKLLGKSAQFAGIATNSSFASNIGQGVKPVSPAPGLVRYAGPWGATFALTEREMKWARGTWKIPYWFGNHKWKVWDPVDISEPRYDRSSFDVVQRHQNNRAALLRHQANIKEYNRRLKVLQGLNMGSNILGAGGIILGAGQFTKDNANAFDLVTGGLWSGAGIAAMASNPIGWKIAAILAVAGALASLGSLALNVHNLSANIKQFAETNKLLDGTFVNSSDITERYLEFVWRKNYDINDLLERRIQLMNELLGLETPKSTTTSDVGNSVFSERYKRYQVADSWTSTSWAADEAAEEFNNYGKQFGLSIYKRGFNWVYDNNGHPIEFNNPDGTSDTNDAVMYTVAAAMEMLNGPYSKKLKAENQKRLSSFLYGRATAEDIVNYMDAFNKKHNPMYIKGLISPLDENASAEEAALWTGVDISKRLPGVELLWATMYPMIEAQQAILDFKKKQASGTLTDVDVVKAIRWGDSGILGQTLADYNPNDILGWYQRLGFVGGEKQWQDPTGQNTPEIMAQNAIGHMERLLKAINQLGPSANDCTKDLQAYANLLITLAQAFLGQGKELSGSRDGEVREINGQKWKWNGAAKEWELLDNNGDIALLPQAIIDFTKNVTSLSQAISTANQDWPTILPITSNTDTSNGAWSYNDVPIYKWGNGVVTNAMVLNPLHGPYNSVSNFSYTPGYFGGGWDAYAMPLSTQTKPVGLTPVQFGAYINSVNGNNKNISNNALAGITTDTNNNGTHTSDYRSHQRERAVPKQININIQNLMNVESIDMTDPNNTAVVNNLKREIAYALYEAAADGTMMLNGLTN